MGLSDGVAPTLTDQPAFAISVWKGVSALLTAGK